MELTHFIVKVFLSGVIGTMSNIQAIPSNAEKRFCLVVSKLKVLLREGIILCKFIQLKVRRFFRSAFRGIGFKLSIVFLLISATVSLMVILPNCFDRVPVYSYFIRKFELPITYELTGKIEIFDADENLISTDVEVIVGGYSTWTTPSREYSLNFSSPMTDEIYAIIRYKSSSGKMEVITESITVSDGIHKLEKEFQYYD